MNEFLTNTLYPGLITVGVAIIKIILIYLIGNFVIGYVIKLLVKILDKTKLDETLKTFIKNLTRILLKVFLIIAIIETIGVDTTGLIAVIGGFSLAIGLAFQGALANFAGGMLLLLFKPYKVGDFIDIGGSVGTVEAIEMIATKIRTNDNKIIIFPNGPAANATIVNYSAKNLRRVDLTFGVGYESDLKLVRQTILDVANAHEKVLKDPEPFVRLGEQADSSLNFTVRLWTATEDYWTVHFDMIEKVTDAFNEKGISIPYPQLDVHQVQ